MNQNSTNTAILLFTRTATSEGIYKCFQKHLGRKRQIAIAEKLIQHTIQQVQATQLPYVVIDDEAQVGQSFGERLANALEVTFQKGYEKVLILGNDCPTLCSDMIQSVALQLTQNQLILGPAKDGGAYVIGIDKSIYKRATFIQLPWLTNRLADAFRNWIEDAVVLEEAEDIDDCTTFARFLKSNIKQLQPIIVTLKKIIGQFQLTLINSINLLFPETYLNSILLRGPPLFVQHINL